MPKKVVWLINKWHRHGITGHTSAPLPTESSHFETSRRHPRLLHCYRPHPTIQISSVEPLVCVPKLLGGIRITVNYQKLNKVTEIPQIAIPCVNEVLDTLGGGSLFSVFDLFWGLTQLTIHPDIIPPTVFCTSTGPYEWLRMSQGTAGAPARFVSVMRLVTADLDIIRIYHDDAIGPDDCPINHVATLAAFFALLRLHKITFSPE